jgi:hypothetical protein
MAAEDEFKDEVEHYNCVEPASSETVENAKVAEPQQSEDTVDVVELSLDDDEANLKAENAIEKLHARLTKLNSGIDRSLSAGIKASLNMESAYSAFRDSLSSMSLDRSLYGGLTASVLAGIDMSAYRSSLGSVSIELDRSLRGLTTSAPAGIDMSAYRSSLGSVSIELDRSLRGLTTSALAGIDMSAYRSSLGSVSIEFDRPLRGLTAPALAGIDMSAYRSSLGTVSIEFDRSLRGLTASVLAGIDMSAYRSSLGSVSIELDRSLRGLTTPALAYINMSAYRSRLGSVSIELDRSLRGLTASALPGIDMSAYRSSLGSISIELDRSLRGLTGSTLAGIGMSSPYHGLRDSLSSIRVDRPLYGAIASSAPANIDLRNFYGSAPWSIGTPDITELPPVRYRGREAAQTGGKRIERIHEYVEREDLSILITFPAANEREVLISVVQMSAAYRLLHCFEVRLREVVSTLMESRFGAEWIRTRVPPNLVADWEDKKAKAEKKGFPSARLLDYADFSDYRGIIVQRSNWREIFQPIFGNHKDTEVSFERLEPLRIETMHNRPLSRADAAVLATEVYRLLQKLDRSARN